MQGVLFVFGFSLSFPSNLAFRHQDVHARPGGAGSGGQGEAGEVGGVGGGIGGTRAAHQHRPAHQQAARPRPQQRQSLPCTTQGLKGSPSDCFEL